jgi:hypothetical protein
MEPRVLPIQRFRVSRGNSGLRPRITKQLSGWEVTIMVVLESIVVDLAVLAISGLSALGLGHLLLSVVVKDRRSS